MPGPAGIVPYVTHSASGPEIWLTCLVFYSIPFGTGGISPVSVPHDVDRVFEPWVPGIPGDPGVPGPSHTASLSLLTVKVGGRAPGGR